MKKFLILTLVFVINISTFTQEKISEKPPVSTSVKAGNLIFLSGKVGINPNTKKLVDSSFEAELRQVMENHKEELSKYGLEFDDLVSVIIYLKNMDDYGKVNTIYGEYFKNRYPSRTCIAVKELPAKANVEISGIAVLPEDK